MFDISDLQDLSNITERYVKLTSSVPANRIKFSVNFGHFSGQQDVYK